MPRLSSISSNTFVRKTDPVTYSYPARFYLERSSDRFGEGEDITIFLKSVNVTDGGTVAYTITGVSSPDINNASLTGNFTVNNSIASLTIRATVDAFVENFEVLTLTIDSTGDSISVALFDPAYFLTSNKSWISEGNTFTISLNTLGVNNGTVVPYTITGISSADISGDSLVGTFIVLDGIATKTFTVNEDSNTEGTETFTLSLDSGFDSIDVEIREATYSLASSQSSVNESGLTNSFILTLTTTNLVDGTLVPYTMTGITSADISDVSLTGSFSVTSGSATASFLISQDFLTEGLETIVIALDNGKASTSVAINDTSLTQAYSLSRSAASVNEGGQFIITLTTQNIANGTNIPYTISGVASADINNFNLTGNNFTISNDTASQAFTVTADATTEGSETFTLTLPTIPNTPFISVTINDTSRTPTYSLGRSAPSADEGSTFTIFLDTTDVTNNTSVGYTITGTGITTADLNGASLTGSFVVVDNFASKTFTVTADATTEGTETLTISLNNGQSAVSVPLLDLSKTPSYALSRSVASVNEGSSFSIYMNTTNVSNGTNLPYTITGVSSADISGSSLTGNFVIVNSTATLTLTATADYATEGDETFTITSMGQTISVTFADTTVFATLRATLTTAGGLVNSVDIASTYAICGTPSYSSSRGIAEVFKVADGVRQAQLYDNYNQTTTDDQYGYSVGISDVYMVVGAPNEDAGPSTTGRAYWYATPNTLSIYGRSDNFYGTYGGELYGKSVSISIGRSMVGAIGETAFNPAAPATAATNSGAVGVYGGSGGSSYYNYINPNTNTTSLSDGFGWCVANTDTYGLVYAPNEDKGTAITTGAFYLYTFGTSTPTYTWTPGSTGGDAFGTSDSCCDLTDTYAIVGLSYYTSGANRNGQVWVYNISDGTIKYTVTAPDTVNNRYFGVGVAINSTYFAVADTYVAKVYIYRLSDGALVKTIDQPVGSGTFGYSLAMSETNLIVGATSKAYIYGLG